MKVFTVNRSELVKAIKALYKYSEANRMAFITTNKAVAISLAEKTADKPYGRTEG
ncbi:hypothetical protein L873DRAFT_1818978 [Choiromyces venosus 120613-1]|uniref:Uncharacterized protein n=1 Tax=Choiromyces venosus 120613-1 TaxID=1336337 RepID=A0A3N4J377_9PEZI|nr:hypothetical protein L873DRAFT_1818978 [Choiromyces venosus 120613-1]